MKKKVFIVALLVIVALLLFFCNEKLNKNTDSRSIDPATKDSITGTASKDTILTESQSWI